MAVGRLQSPLITPTAAQSVDATPRNIRGAYQIVSGFPIGAGGTSSAAGSSVYVLQTPLSGGAGRWVVQSFSLRLIGLAAPSTAYEMIFNLNVRTFTALSTGGDGTFIVRKRTGDPTSTLALSLQGTTAITLGTNTALGAVASTDAFFTASLSNGDIIFDDYLIGPPGAGRIPFILGNGEGLELQNVSGVRNGSTVKLGIMVELFEVTAW